MSDTDIARARLRAVRAKAQLTDTLRVLKARFMPRAIARHLAVATKEKAVDVAEATVDTVKARPGVAVGVAALAALFLARKPIARAISSGPAETPAVPARSRRKPASRNPVRKAKP